MFNLRAKYLYDIFCFIIGRIDRQDLGAEIKTFLPVIIIL